ncbi:MAG: hypothetical protein WAN12_01305 [Candidatus Acidiferrum sp.]
MNPPKYLSRDQGASDDAQIVAAFRRFTPQRKTPQASAAFLEGGQALERAAG